MAPSNHTHPLSFAYSAPPWYVLTGLPDMLLPQGLALNCSHCRRASVPRASPPALWAPVLPSQYGLFQPTSWKWQTALHPYSSMSCSVSLFYFSSPNLTPRDIYYQISLFSITTPSPQLECSPWEDRDFHLFHLLSFAVFQYLEQYLTHSKCLIDILEWVTLHARNVLLPERSC